VGGKSPYANLGLSIRSSLLLEDGEPDSLTLGEGNKRLVTLSDDEHVLDSGGEGVAGGVLDVDNVVTTLVLLSVEDDANSAGVVTSGNHGDVAVVEADEVLHLSGLDVEKDRVVDLDERVGVPDGPSVVGGESRDGLLSQLDVLHLAELVGSLLRADAVDGHASLGVVEDAEVLVGLLDGDDVHEAGWVAHVGAHLSVNLHHALHEDGLGLTSGEGVLQAVTQDQDEWQALPGLMWSWGWLRGKDTAELVKHPVLWSIDTLQVLGRSASSHGVSSLFDSS